MALSHDEAVQKLSELRTEVEGLVSSYNEAYQAGKFEEAMKLSKEIEEKVNEYTSVARTDTFEACKASGNPMLAAVTALSFVSIATKDETKDGTNFPVRVIVPKERAIDLYKLHKYIDGGIGNDKNWLYIAEKFNALLTAAAVLEIGVKGANGKPLTPKDVCDSYAMSNIAREIDLGKAPTSDTAMLKQLEIVIAAMIGDDYKVTTHDLKFLKRSYCKKSRKALTLTMANHKYLRGYLAEICHKLVTGKTYDAEYKKVKQQ